METQLSVRRLACRRIEGERGETPLPSKLLLLDRRRLDAIPMPSTAPFQSGSSSSDELRLLAACAGREAARRCTSFLELAARTRRLPPPRPPQPLMASSPVGHSMPLAGAARALAAVLPGGRLAAVGREARGTAPGGD